MTLSFENVTKQIYDTGFLWNIKIMIIYFVYILLVVFVILILIQHKNPRKTKKIYNKAFSLTWIIIRIVYNLNNESS